MTSARFVLTPTFRIIVRSIETHILTPSPYYRGQFLTLDNRVVEIDKEYVKEISGKIHAARPHPPPPPRFGELSFGQFKGQAPMVSRGC